MEYLSELKKLEKLEKNLPIQDSFFSRNPFRVEDLLDKLENTKEIPGKAVKTTLRSISHQAPIKMSRALKAKVDIFSTAVLARYVRRKINQWMREEQDEIIFRIL
ncbi:MAG: hypothetical protein QY321_00360 [Patescibacteria group bacterium]|nr:MAG: hypothetical protein QY321_00360 [Patescibacteria group bacterium]